MTIRPISVDVLEEVWPVRIRFVCFPLSLPRRIRAERRSWGLVGSAGFTQVYVRGIWKLFKKHPPWIFQTATKQSWSSFSQGEIVSLVDGLFSMFYCTNTNEREHVSLHSNKNSARKLLSWTSINKSLQLINAWWVCLLKSSRRSLS